VDTLEVTGKEYFVWDDEIPCFGVRVLPSGRKTYVIQYKVGGRGGETRRKALGQHGVITAEEARNDEAWRAALKADSLCSLHMKEIFSDEHNLFFLAARAPRHA
jgi:hypothetical protein